ncbi:MAG: acylphosphatase [Bacteroidetes bacterium]|nr:acylphosphatase [Bacteroidota bacterium]
MEISTKHITIKGIVQGVFFRKYTKQKADELHISGWVRNIDNGDVEIMAQAIDESLDQFIQWCWKGSPKSLVKDVIVKNTVSNQLLQGFIIDH